MAIKIVTDSTCDLPQSLVAEHDITVIPMQIHVGERTYRDGVDLSRQAFYEGLPGYPAVPQTAAAAPGTIRQVYEGLTTRGTSEILSIHISPSLSGVLNAARLGAEEAHSAPVTLFDSRQLSMGIGFLVVRAAEAVAAGRSMPEILNLLEEQVLRTHVFAITDSFEYLRRSGRVSLLQYHIGSLLKICPLLKMYDGRATAGVVRSYGKGISHLVHLVARLGRLERLCLLHANVPDQAEILRQRLQPFQPRERPLLLARVNPSIGVHVGPGCLGVACVTAPRP